MWDKFWTWVKTRSVIGNFIFGFWTMFKVAHTDSQGLWDFKLFGGSFLIGFAVYYVGWIDKGNVFAFLAIAGVGAFFHGWAASPWGGSAPNISVKLPETAQPKKEGE